tara:strand:- start:799 stop:1623 length:825 start_codon:yes stop_codon:yes gene_type:complete
MESLNKQFIFLLKITILFFVIYYLSNNINKKFFENISNSYLIIIITIPILIFRIFINSLKISSLLKILNKKNESIKNIFKILLEAQLSLALPGSFIASKAWIDGNLIRKFKFNLKEYYKFNLLILLFSILIILFFILLKFYASLLLIGFVLIFCLYYRNYVNYFLYFFFYLVNLLLNISISFLVVYHLSPELLSDNIMNIFFSSLISVYLDTFSFLPFNIGYSQTTYGLTFDFLSLSKDIAFTIASIIQMSQIIIVLFVFLFFFKKLKKNNYKS